MSRLSDRCTERRCSSHYKHQPKRPHNSSSNASALVAVQIADQVQTLPQNAPHLHQPATWLYGRDDATHGSKLITAWPQVCQSTYCTRRQRWKSCGERAFSHAGPVACKSLLNFIRSESNTKRFKKLLKTNFFLRRRFIVWVDNKPTWWWWWWRWRWWWHSTLYLAVLCLRWHPNTRICSCCPFSVVLSQLPCLKSKQIWSYPSWNPST